MTALCLVETEDGGLADTSARALTIARDLGTDLAAVVFSDGIAESLASALADYGVSSLYIVAGIDGYAPQAWARALAELSTELVAIPVELTPPVIRSLGHQPCHLRGGGDVERDVVHAGAQAGVEHARHHVGRRLDHDPRAVGAPHLPVLPAASRFVAQLLEQPAPRFGGPIEVGHPELEVVDRHRANATGGRRRCGRRCAGPTSSGATP